MSITFQGFTFRKTEFVLEKSEEEFLLRKEGFTYKKTGIANLKIHKNRIYRRKKGDDKNRKKKDFFPPQKKVHIKNKDIFWRTFSV